MAQLFMEYRALMFFEIRKLFRDESAVEDIMQETIIRLVEKVPLLRSLDRNRRINYIITASLNQARSYHRARRKILEVSFDDEDNNLINTVSDTIDVEGNYIRRNS
jgi:DNA-directed RNA polymerase specialized sigma24 family protein